MEYYDGQIITDHTAFANWANSHGNTLTDRPNDDGTYTVYSTAASEAEAKAERIIELKEKLNSTDYVVIKIAEAETVEEQAQLREHYAEVIANRKAWREEINELEE